MGKSDRSNNSVFWNHVKIYLFIAFLAMLHYISRVFELQSEIEENSILNTILLTEIESMYGSILIVVTILVGFNIARTTDRKDSLVNSFSAGFIGALAYQLIFLLFAILMVSGIEGGAGEANPVGGAGEANPVEDNDFIEYVLGTSIFHGFLALFIAIPFQEMGLISRDVESIQELIIESNSHIPVIMDHKEEIAKLIQSRDETNQKIREIRASLGDDLISFQHSSSEESRQLGISDAFDMLEEKEEAAELELSDAFNQLDE